MAPNVKIIVLVALVMIGGFWFLLHLAQSGPMDLGECVMLRPQALPEHYVRLAFTCGNRIVTLVEAGKIGESHAR